MMTIRLTRIAAALLLANGIALLGMTGCKSGKQPQASSHAEFPTDTEFHEEGEMEPLNVPKTEPGAAVDPSVIVPREGADDFPANDREQMPPGRQVPELPNVYFAFDSAEINNAARAQLETAATWMKNNPGFHILLRGHTDRSGTDEYNLALGERRALQVRDFLIERGIDPDRLETVSYGESIPVVEAEDEQAMSSNRRVEFFIYEVEEDGDGG